MRVIGRRELAKEWGVSPAAVDAMLMRGELRRVARGLIDADHAATVRAAQDPRERERALLIKMQKSTQVSDSTGSDDAPAPGKGNTIADVLYRARATKAVHDAKMAELNLRVVQGGLVERETVRSTCHNSTQLLVSRLKAMPSRLGSLASSVSSADECTALVQAEIDALIVEFNDAIAAI